MARAVAGWTLGVIVGALTLAAPSARAVEADLPVIVDVVAPRHLRVGAAGELRLTYRAPQGNVVAVVLEIEDLEAPRGYRSTRQHEFGVVARAFGRETGDLVVPLSFGTPGWKRVTLTLVTDEREPSDPAVVEIEVIP